MIRRLLPRLRFRRIRDRFLAGMIAVSVPPLFLLGRLSYNIARETLVADHIESNQTQLATASETADMLFQNIGRLTRLILADNVIREELRGSGVEQLSSYRLANRLLGIASSNYVDTRYIDSICLFDRQFRSACYGMPAVVATPGNWYVRVLEAFGADVYFGHNVLMPDEHTFSVAKLFRDPADLYREPTGVIVVNVKKSIFEDVFSRSRLGGFAVLAPAGDGTEIVFDNRPLSARETSGDLATLLGEQEAGNILVTRYTNQTTGWLFVQVVPTAELLRESGRIGTITAWLACLIAVVALVLAIAISRTITRPLSQLQAMMVDWSRGTLPGDQPFAQDEVGVLAETFKRITSENKLLSERLVQAQLRNREAQLRALQAQIRPHFLYNTLDSIYWMAVLENHPKIAQMAIALSESFKYTFGRGSETVPLSAELEHVRHYLQVQNLRYDNRFHYVEDVDPALLQQPILKLLLQPLVENAIYHGLEPKVGEGTIRLTGRRVDGSIVLTVEDDGVGIENMQATEQGYGLHNVRERLALYYGPKSSLRITSAVHRGTTVEIQLPVAAEGEQPYVAGRNL